MLDDAVGAPLNGAVITVAGTTIRAVTSETGAFSISGLMPGRYSLSFAKDGYTTKSARLVLHPDRKTAIHVNLSATTSRPNGSKRRGNRRRDN